MATAGEAQLSAPANPRVITPTFLSPHVEKPEFARNWNLLAADNAQLTLVDEHGIARQVVDLVSTYGAVNFGHRNPGIAPFYNYAADLAPYFCPPEAERFAHWLTTRLDLPEHRVLYQIGGSFAVSTAVSLAQHLRPGMIVALRGGFHGLGVDTIAMSSSRRSALQNTRLADELVPLVRLIDPQETPSWRGVSCFVYEPIQGANGYLPVAPDWLRACVTSAAEAGVVVIADEIQAGFHRHGPFSPSRAMSLTPDILLFGKSMTNGLYPLSAVVHHRRLHGSADAHGALAHTFQTAALGTYAACAVAEYLDRVPQAPAADSIGGQLTDLETRLRAREGVATVHRTGPTLSFALREPSVTALCERGLQEGILLLSGGNGKRIRVAPPLTIEPELLTASLATLEGLVEEFTTERHPVQRT